MGTDKNWAIDADALDRMITVIKQANERKNHPMILVTIDCQGFNVIDCTRIRVSGRLPNCSKADLKLVK